MAQRTNKKKPSDNSKRIAGKAPGEQQKNHSASASRSVCARASRRRYIENIPPLAPDFDDIRDDGADTQAVSFVPPEEKITGNCHSQSPGSAIKSSPADDIPTWRRKHRSLNNINHLYILCRTIITNQFLAVALILAGTAFSFVIADTKIAAALATLITATASYIVFAFSQNAGIRNSGEVEAMRARFENLEDRAWELRESEERYRNIAESFGDMLIMRRPDGMICYCNPAFAECFGKTPTELQGTDFKPEPVHASPIEKGSGRRTREFAFQTRIGQNIKLRWFAWLDLPVRDEKLGGTMTLSVARDITSFKQAERTLDAARDKAEQANRAKSRFLAMVSHEMRTPLNGILGMSQLLGGTKLTPEQKSYLDAVSNSGSSLLRLIEEMLDLTMIEAGRFQLHKETFDLKPLLTNVVELMSARAYAKDIGLGLFIAPSVPLQIEGDADRIRQILLNLIGNAIKFTQKGGIAVHCYVKSTPQNHPDTQVRLCFDIADTGQGLSEVDKARVFNEFERVDDGNNRKSGGAGLGLAISRAIAAQMGGTLELTRTGPNGSQFTFELPVCATAPVSEDGLLRGKLIVIATANKMESECLSMQLSAHGVMVRLVTSVSQAMKSWNKKGAVPHAILFDSNTLSNVKTALQKTAKRHADRPKFIVMIDPAKRKSLPRYLDCGADSYLIRPVREDSLLAILNGEQPHKKFTIETEDIARPSNLSKNTDLAGTRILLAEDNDINAMLVMAILKKVGASVDRAMDGDDAFKKFTEVEKESKYDFVLMDMHMPVMDGLEAATRIRKWEKRKKSKMVTPIFALSADDQADTRAQAFEAGMNRFLIKPIDPTALVEVILENTEAK